MSEFINVEEVVRVNLPDDFDETCVEYIISVIESMELEERQDIETLEGIICPFLIESGFCDEEESLVICRKIAVGFGSSGLKNMNKNDEIEAVPVLLEKSVRIIDNSEQTGLKLDNNATYGKVIISQKDGTSIVGSNSNYDSKSIPTTSKDMRKLKKTKEQMQIILEKEKAKRQLELDEVYKERMNAALLQRQRQQEAITKKKTKTKAKSNKVQTIFNRKGGNVVLDKFNITHPSGSGELLSDVSMTLVSGHRYGLIGRNGAGKTTLMNHLARYKNEELSMLRVLLVDQHMEGDDQNAIEWCLRNDVERTLLLEEEQILTKHIQYEQQTGDSGQEQPPPLPSHFVGCNLELCLQECYDEMETAGVHTAEARAIKVLNGLGFEDREDMLRPTCAMSGGWVMRAALASAIYNDPDLLLLDEPTNHLDLHALVWLENWLNHVYTGIALVVSHDTCFLNNIGTDIIELQSCMNGRTSSSLIQYSGDYHTYEVTLEDTKKSVMKNKDVLDAKIEKLKEFIAREGKKFDGPAHQAQRKMKMKQLQSAEEACKELVDKNVNFFEDDKHSTIKLPVPTSNYDSDQRLLCLDKVSFGYTTDEESKPAKLLFENVEMSIYANSRIVFLGKNGCGKTSLLNVLIGDVAPTSGSVTRYAGAKITMLQQHHYKGDQLDPLMTSNDHIRVLQLTNKQQYLQDQLLSDRNAVDSTVNNSMEELMETMTRQDETAIRTYLACFGINGATPMIPVRHLSGGQKMKLALAVALYNKPDILILDEPTNHLDSETVTALCNALSTFEGAVIAVSHDEAFVNSILNTKHPSQKNHSEDDNSLNNEIYVVGDRSVTYFEGTFKDYKKLVMNSVL